jgi:hypothetical protein
LAAFFATFFAAFFAGGINGSPLFPLLKGLMPSEVGIIGQEARFSEVDLLSRPTDGCRACMARAPEHRRGHAGDDTSPTERRTSSYSNDDHFLFASVRLNGKAPLMTLPPENVSLSELL